MVPCIIKDPGNKKVPYGIQQDLGKHVMIHRSNHAVSTVDRRVHESNFPDLQSHVTAFLLLHIRNCTYIHHSCPSLLYFTYNIQSIKSSTFNFKVYLLLFNFPLPATIISFLECSNSLLTAILIPTLILFQLLLQTAGVLFLNVYQSISFPFHDFQMHFE